MSWDGLCQLIHTGLGTLFGWFCKFFEVVQYNGILYLKVKRLFVWASHIHDLAKFIGLSVLTYLWFLMCWYVTYLVTHCLEFTYNSAILWVVVRPSTESLSSHPPSSFNMIMPVIQLVYRCIEIVCSFLPWFIYLCSIYCFNKSSLAKKSMFIEESKHFHY
jgi:hypothetical protein